MSVKQDSKKGSARPSVLDYLNRLVWDKKPRLDRWLIDYAGADDTSRTRLLSRAVLKAAVRRVRQPGYAFDQLLILESPQGTGKSAALRILAGDDHFTDELPVSDPRRLIEVTAGKWIVEAAELRGLAGGDLRALKACLSRSVDEARMAYQREVTRVPRQFVIIGTTNEIDGYLAAAVSNHRFWSVRVQCFDLARLRADRDQLWAEAVASMAEMSVAVELLSGDAVELP